VCVWYSNISSNAIRGLDADFKTVISIFNKKLFTYVNVASPPLLKLGSCGISTTF